MCLSTTHLEWTFDEQLLRYWIIIILIFSVSLLNLLYKLTFYGLGLFSLKITKRL